MKGESFTASDYLIHWMGIPVLAEELVILYNYSILSILCLIFLFLFFSQRHYNLLSDDEKIIYDAYADGINYYALNHENELIHNAIFPITGKDIVGHFMYIIQDIVHLQGLLNTLLSKQELKAPISTRSDEILTHKEYLSYARDTLNMKASTAYTANSKLTGKGTYLAINPHQTWDKLSTFFEISVSSDEGWDFTGYTLPGFPVPMMGYNSHLGWGITVNHPDIIDVFYLDENPQNETQYLLNNQWIDLEVRTVQTKYQMFGFISRYYEHELYFSKFGPVVRTPQGLLAVSFSGFQPQTVHAASQFLGMNKATTLEDWENALQLKAMPLMNFIYADEKDNILFKYNALLPQRDEQ